MSDAQQSLDFDDVCDVLLTIGSQISGSELHGLLIGELAAGKRMDDAGWLQSAKEHLDVTVHFNPEQTKLMQSFYRASFADISDAQLGFYPLLPDDEAEMPIRLMALGQWCQGFLAGFALVEKKVAEVSDALNDALNDLAAISQVGENDDDQFDDSAEEDYAQLVEYVRLAAMNIFLDYAQDQGEQKPQLDTQQLFENRKLH